MRTAKMPWAQTIQYRSPPGRMPVTRKLGHVQNLQGKGSRHQNMFGFRSVWRQLRHTSRKPAGRSNSIGQMSSTVKVLAASAILGCVLGRVFTLSKAVIVPSGRIVPFAICLINTVSNSFPRKPGLSRKACQSLILSE